jgi:uncharacterized membrane protein
MGKEILEMLDCDKNGVTSEEEIVSAAKIQELQEKISKSEAQEKMAWLSLISILVFTVLLFMPFVSIDKVVAIGEFIGMFYISLAGILAAYMGTQAWTMRK